MYTHKKHSTSACLQVPNQVLMNNGVTNLSESGPVEIYNTIEVDASMSPDAIRELSARMKATAAAHPHLFDDSCTPKAYIMNIVSPLKYQVCVPYCPGFGLFPNSR
jgi:hypothetical protein